MGREFPRHRPRQVMFRPQRDVLHMKPFKAAETIRGYTKGYQAGVYPTLKHAAI